MRRERIWLAVHLAAIVSVFPSPAGAGGKKEDTAVYFGEALRAARQIPDSFDRAFMLARIARTQAQAGQASAARETLRLAQSLRSSAEAESDSNSRFRF